MEYMATLPDKAFDLAIVDVPYGIKISSRKSLGSPAPFGGKKNKSKIKNKIQPAVYKVKDWDDFAPDKKYFDELRRISRNQIIWGANHFISRIPYDSSCWIVWDKQTTADYADAELAYTSFKSAVRIFSFKWSGCLQEDMKNKETRIHPTQKPVQLYKWLLKNYATPNMKIIDTHLGSGSSAIAAYDFGCDFVGMEIDKDYYDAAVKRFEIYKMQQKLF
jgi:site-specific DNA-methyltransferase (adenine-specific)